MCTNFLTSLLCFESFKKSGVVVNLVLFIDFQWNRTFLFDLVCFIGVFLGRGGWKGEKGFHLALSATIVQEDQLSYIHTLSSDFVANSYSKSWDSSCEQSWVPVQNQCVPVKKKKWVRNWKCLGLYVTRQLIWRQTPKVCITVHWN